MKAEVHRRLQELSETHDLEYGKLVQKLLAIAFCEAGAERVIERSTQGIDLEVTLSDGRRIALEVKTTQGELTFAAKDIKGLAARLEEGFEPYFGILGLRLIDDWLFVHFWPGEIQPNQKYSPTQLRPYRDPGIETWIKPFFSEAVLKHVSAAKDGAQSALDKILKKYASNAVP